MNNIFHSYAKKCLRKNRARTAVTVVGILLSTAMLAAVTTVITSIQGYGIRYEEALVGDWQIELDGAERGAADDLLEDARVARVYTLSSMGYAVLPDGENAYKPYLCLRGMDEAFAEHMSLHLLEGRMPEREGEILVPEHVERNGGVSYAVGDVITLGVGRRVDSDGTELLQDTALRYREGTDEGAANGGEEWNAGAEGAKAAEITVLEKLVDVRQRTCTVVGIYERPTFEMTTSPGYTLLTVDDGQAERVDLFFVMKRAWLVKAFFRELGACYPQNRMVRNNALLRFYGVSDRSDFNYLLYGMGGILIVIIITGSVALIYNAFAISVGERTREFGMLSSVGATKRQLRQTVRYEALQLCLLGILPGMLAGICGIGITLSFFTEAFAYLIGGVEGVSMQVRLSPEALLMTALLGVGTVLLSARLPMRRALKVSAIAAIRQNEDIRTDRRSVRLPRWVRRHYAGAGANYAHELAWKNFARNKRSYRTTTVSLALSILLFVSAGSFSEYLFGSYRDAVEISSYDVSVHLSGEDPASVQAIRERMRQAEGTAEIYHLYYMYVQFVIAPEDMTEERKAQERLGKDPQQATGFLNFLQDDIFAELLDHYGLDAQTYQEAGEPRAVVFCTTTNELEESYPVLAGSCDSLTCSLDAVEGEDVLWELPVGDLVEQPLAPQEASARCLYLRGTGNMNCLTLVYPESCMETLFATRNGDVQLWNGFAGETYYLAADHAAAAAELEQLAGADVYVQDVAAEEEQYRMVRLMIRVFCDGFLALLSLIAAANVFHTISTNLHARKRELAVLRSLGMTPRELSGMLNFECILYGCRGLLLGLFLSLLGTLLMYFMSHERSLAGYYVPLRYPLLAAVFVFLLVYAAMCYGRWRVKKERLLDAIRQ